MKKVLLSVFAVMLIGFSNTTRAQCTFANPGIRMVSPPYTDASGKCVLKIELSFDILHNAGGKYFWVHFWPTGNYPNYSYPQSHPPTTSKVVGENTALDSSIVTFGFFHQGSSKTPQTSYPPDINAPNFQSGYTINEIQGGGILPGSDRYTLTGIDIVLPLDCSVPQSVTADLWESQAAQAQTVACVSKGVILVANDPKAVGGIYCAPPRTYEFTINSINPAGLLVNYEAFIDDGDHVFNKTLDTLKISYGNNILLDNTNSYRYYSGILGYLPYSNLKAYADKDLWVVVTGPSFPNEVYLKITNICIPLSVRFLNFTGKRDHNNVLLKWTTASENNSSGFALERNTNGTWQEIAYVPSLASGGYSDIQLNYSYNDINDFKGITQYRVRQVDLQMKSTYSSIIVIAGENQGGKITIYPNPSGGNVSILFDPPGIARDMILTDMTGRIINQWKGISGNNFSIENLKSGVYFLKVITVESREQQVQKIVVAN